MKNVKTVAIDAPASVEELDKKEGKRCPACGADITEQFMNWLHELTGLPLDRLKNGDGLREISWKLQVAEKTMTLTGLEINQTQITKETLKAVENLLNKRLAEDEKKKYEEELKHKDELIRELERSKLDLTGKEIEKLKQTIEDSRKLMEMERERTKEFQRRCEEVEDAYNELKTKVISNPALKGALAHFDLKEDLEGCFPDQSGCFLDISKKNYGDLLWNIRISVGKQWIDSGISVTIDSKDKRKITEEDLEKLGRDMRFNKSKVGMIIASKQSQLRLKESPCGICELDEGYILITSREASSHHLAIKFVRDILAKMLYESNKKEKSVVDISKLSTLMNDLVKYKDYHRGIRLKANGIIKDVDSEENYLDAKIKEAWEILSKPSSEST
jgi:hypothetical protein